MRLSCLPFRKTGDFMASRCSEPIRVAVFQAAGPERDAFVQVLELDGFEVVAVATDEQVGMLLECPPDVLVVDLSGRGGRVLRLFLQYHQAEPYTPFLALGTMHEDRDRCRELAVGLERFFVKPIDPPLFLMRLRTAAMCCRSQHAAVNVGDVGKVVSIAATPGNPKS
jgi:DNA-binding response OmpR family regulator